MNSRFFLNRIYFSHFRNNDDIRHFLCFNEQRVQTIITITLFLFTRFDKILKFLNDREDIFLRQKDKGGKIMLRA